MQHPAAKSMIEISRTQDEEVGDGTTSVIILGMYIAYLMLNSVTLLQHSWRGVVHGREFLGATNSSHGDYQCLPAGPR